MYYSYGGDNEEDDQEEEEEEENDDEEEEEEEEYDYAIELYRAIEKDDRNALRQLLDNGADPGLKPFEDKSRALLHICCDKGHIECAKILLDYEAAIAVTDEWGMTSLMYSTVRQDMGMTKMLLSRDSEMVHCRDIEGKSALHMAIETGQPELVELLLNNGANVNASTDNGISPLMVLCMDSNIENKVRLLRILIDAGADVSLRDYKCKRTALHNAVINGNFELFEILLCAGSDPNLLDVTGRSPLTNLICRHARITERQPDVSDDVLTAAIQLIQAGTNLNNNLCEYSNPLVNAAFVKASKLVRVILDYGADPDVTFRSGTTALLVSVLKRDLACIRALLEWNCRLDMKGRVAFNKYDELELDPMELAIEKGFWEVVVILVSAGYRVSRLPYLRLDFTGNTPKSLSLNSEMYTFLRIQASNPLLLFHSAILAVFKALNTNTHGKLNELPLPEAIKRFMRQGEFCELENGGNSKDIDTLKLYFKSMAYV
ncbi:serine/threonine-protein phosphatase 6 regulatory ankyrin repeat subunit C-like [Ylistrum balloti]|uniref:serine/threonine-protein phosphatase 6 regulatory ankyrin repeat subunit C-like n=1 Tax=Ylistrum balloti TaxID=509963 RepID=UPI002905A0CE|nr:serine/threonine-protein phosphatase 6 regulatory ankyrin repeat subunit C-like [Ylistrum balloti]